MGVRCALQVEDAKTTLPTADIHSAALPADSAAAPAVEDGPQPASEIADAKRYTASSQLPQLLLDVNLGTGFSVQNLKNQPAGRGQGHRGPQTLRVPPLRSSGHLPRLLCGLKASILCFCRVVGFVVVLKKRARCLELGIHVSCSRNYCRCARLGNRGIPARGPRAYALLKIAWPSQLLCPSV